MPKKKKKFIDKKNATTFRVVHRSQRDPLIVDEEAPQRVLLEVGGSPLKPESKNHDRKNLEELKEEQRKFGVFFDDGYNYLQHLRAADESPDWEMVQDRVRINKNDFSARSQNNEDKPKFNLPSSVFESGVQEKVGMLNKAAPQSGPRLDWDPDIVAALDDGVELDDPDNVLEDDFVLKANTCDSVDKDDFEGSDVSSNFESDSNDSLDAMEEDSDYRIKDTFGAEETKSRFTEYSLTCSVVERNKGLQQLDEHFEVFYEQYDDDKIGALHDEEMEGALHHDNKVVQDALKEYDEIKSVMTLKDVIKPNEVEIGESAFESDEENLVEVTVSETPKYDIESIISTYSNKYNHPTLIKEPPKKAKIAPIKVSSKTGIAVEGLKSNGGLTKQKLMLLNSLNPNLLSEGSATMSKVSKASSFRPKDEAPEERRIRKANVKLERKVRRLEKKANKDAFKEEEKRQKKTMMNVNNTLKTICLQ